MDKGLHRLSPMVARPCAELLTQPFHCRVNNAFYADKGAPVFININPTAMSENPLNFGHRNPLTHLWLAHSIAVDFIHAWI